MNALYGRLPQPLQISDGNFSYDESRIGVRQLSGKLGKSSFSELSGTLGLGQNQDLEIRSGNSHIFMTEIVPWLASFDKMHEISKYYGGDKSIIVLSRVKVKGPLFNPKKWDFNVSGEAKDLVLKNIPGRPGPVTIVSAKFRADPHTLEYTDGQTSILDGVLNISGLHKNYFQGLDKDVRLKFNARLGSKSVQWLSNVFHMPAQLQLRPLTLSASQVNYARNGKKKLSASLAIQDGPKISTDMVLSSDKTVIKKIFVQDHASKATIGLSLYNNILTFSFNPSSTTVMQYSS